MTEPAELPSVQKQLEDWLDAQPAWLQHAAEAILAGAPIDSEKIKAFGQMAIDQANRAEGVEQLKVSLKPLFGNRGAAVSLRELSGITGIGQLRPRRPLPLGEKPITVVFGSNGSGKSSYVRILKQACGARQKGELHKDVFSVNEEPQGCKISYGLAGTAQFTEWHPAHGVVPDLSSIDIFDTHCGHSYLASEGKARYEPQALQFLSELATHCDTVAGLLTKSIEARSSKLPKLPDEYSRTPAGAWFNALTFKTKAEEIEKWCTWGEAQETELEELTKALAERSPEDRAKELRTRKSQVQSILQSLSVDLDGLSDEACRKIGSLRKQVVSAQKTAELAAVQNLELAVLDGIGTKEWSDLWTIARQYSEATAYKEIPFPNIGDEARCVLCQQDLNGQAKARLRSFEEFVKDEASKALNNLKKDLALAIGSLPVLPSAEMIATKVSAAGLDDSAAATLAEIYNLSRQRLAIIVAENAKDPLPPQPDKKGLLQTLTASAERLEEQAKAFLAGANEAERAKKKARQAELRAQQTVSAQEVAINGDVERLKRIDQLKKASTLCKTRGISIKKDNLAEILITPSYVEAFNAELKALGARKVSVELVKTKVSKGAILHQVRLKDSVRTTPIHEILSEGEHRIICLAAFLADSKGNPNGSTFVFDDPISSLDLDYEENVVQRLVKLSADRPVIVFTHRLSLLGMVRDYAKKDNVEVATVTLRREPWGAGEPGDEAIEADNPKKALNHHLPNRIAEAKRIFEESGTTTYEPYAQSICTEIRKTIERLIEFDLMADVIQRHRRAINTLGKLDKLASITPEDCAFVDDMMTKYSRYEHAQSREATVALPEPAELAEDIAELKKWRDGLENRRK